MQSLYRFDGRWSMTLVLHHKNFADILLNVQTLPKSFNDFTQLIGFPLVDLQSGNQAGLQLLKG